jgi:hypothetical protein
MKAEDYETNPLFVSSKENQLLNEFFLYLLEDFSNSPVPTLHLSR